MKTIRNCEMNEEVDTYISVSLKNWAANQEPPPTGRERLLHQARISTLIREKSMYPKFFFTRKSLAAHSSNGFIGGDFSTVRLWSLNVATGLRIVA
jgi:hypothetical protein